MAGQVLAYPGITDDVREAIAYAMEAICVNRPLHSIEFFAFKLREYNYQHGASFCKYDLRAACRHCSQSEFTAVACQHKHTDPITNEPYKVVTCTSCKKLARRCPVCYEMLRKFIPRCKQCGSTNRVLSSCKLGHKSRFRAATVTCCEDCGFTLVQCPTCKGMSKQELAAAKLAVMQQQEEKEDADRRAQIEAQDEEAKKALAEAKNRERELSSSSNPTPAPKPADTSATETETEGETETETETQTEAETETEETSDANITTSDANASDANPTPAPPADTPGPATVPVTAIAADPPTEGAAPGTADAPTEAAAAAPEEPTEAAAPEETPAQADGAAEASLEAPAVTEETPIPAEKGAAAAE